MMCYEFVGNIGPDWELIKNRGTEVHEFTSQTDALVHIHFSGRELLLCFFLCCVQAI